MYPKSDTHDPRTVEDLTAIFSSHVPSSHSCRLLSSAQCLLFPVCKLCKGHVFFLPTQHASLYCQCPVTCPQLVDNLPHAIVNTNSSSRIFGSTTTIQCQQGFVLSGVAPSSPGQIIVRCGPNGKWSNTTEIFCAGEQCTLRFSFAVTRTGALAMQLPSFAPFPFQVEVAVPAVMAAIKGAANY